MQLVAYGAQDIYLTGNPQITFFKVVYRRHTNFSMEAIVQTINGTPSADASSTVTISRNGDLVSKIYVNSRGVADDAIDDGTQIISEVELEIGGQRIDKHTAQWNNVWNELSTPASKAVGLKAMQGCIGTNGIFTTATGVGLVQIPLNFWFCRNPGLALPLIALQYHEVKLKFKWGTGAASGTTNGGIPQAEVVCDYIYLDTDERRRFAQVSHEYLIEQVQEQTMSGGATATQSSEKLNFNHPVKELIWTSPATVYNSAQLKLNGHDRFSEQESEYFQIRQPYDFHTAVPGQNLPLAAQREGLATFDTATVVGGGVHTFVAAPAVGAAGFTLSAAGVLVLSVLKAALLASAVSVGDFLLIGFTNAAGSSSHLAQVSAVVDGTTVAGANTLLTITFTVPPSPALPGAAVATDTVSISVVTGSALTARTSLMSEKINVYSFGLKPEEHQPSGTCNFSRIDNAQLILRGAAATLPGSSHVIYAVNYNVLRIMSGMGGLAYSN
jgi:hypothetical protein